MKRLKKSISKILFQIKSLTILKHYMSYFKKYEIV